MGVTTFCVLDAVLAGLGVEAVLPQYIGDIANVFVVGEAYAYTGESFAFVIGYDARYTSAIAAGD